MINKRRIITTGTTFVFAAVVSHLINSGDAIAQRVVPQQARTDIGPLPALPSDVIAAATFRNLDALPISRVTAISQSVNVPYDGATPTNKLFQLSCDMTLELRPEPGAMFSVMLDAPCYQRQRITITHGGLEFADITDPDGQYNISMPVLADGAMFSVTFADDRLVEAIVPPIDAHGFLRAAIMWSGANGLHIHAFENGAKFGQSGHVWANLSNTSDAGLNATGGVLTQLGNPDVFYPKLAEVYSITGPIIGTAENIRLTVEAEVSADTCGKNIIAKSFQISGLGDVSSANVLLEMPDCDGKNGFLVLKNLLQDLNITQN